MTISSLKVLMKIHRILHCQSVLVKREFLNLLREFLDDNNIMGLWVQNVVFFIDNDFNDELIQLNANHLRLLDNFLDNFYRLV